MKLLLYCTKAKPYLYKTEDTTYPAYPIGYHTDKDLKLKLSNTNELANLNGKIVAECDFEVEELMCDNYEDARDGYVGYFHALPNDDFEEGEKELQKKSCLDELQINGYLQEHKGYAIHIKNLHIFEKPRDLRDYYTNRIYTKIEDVYTDEIQIKGSEWVRPIKQAPQNMMYAFDYYGTPFVLISIKPEWLCKILNGEKTIEVRKKVLKEMI